MTTYKHQKIKIKINIYRMFPLPRLSRADLSTLPEIIFHQNDKISAEGGICPTSTQTIKSPQHIAYKISSKMVKQNHLYLSPPPKLSILLRMLPKIRKSKSVSLSCVNCYLHPDHQLSSRYCLK